MAHETIKVETNGRVGVITLHRPKSLNALNTTLMDEVVEAAQTLDANANVGCIIITGSEKAFAAGADIKEMQPLNYVEAYNQDFFAALGRVEPRSQTGNRRCIRICLGWWL